MSVPDKFKDQRLLRVSRGRLKGDWCTKSLHGEKKVGDNRPLTLQRKTLHDLVTRR